jgi:hypothetical protein
MSRFKKPLWWVKLTNYEYWPMFALYFPTSLYWTWLIIKSRSLTFFTLTNPIEEFGQFFGASKFHTLEKIQRKYLPLDTTVELGTSMEKAKARITAAGIEYPFIIKPNWGERGVNVERVNNDEELASYLEKTDRDSIVQEFITHPIELGVFYNRRPDGSHSEISGITMKEFMVVTGDGISTVEMLMEQNDRFRFQIKRLKVQRPRLVKSIPANGEKVLLEPVGNHNRGTKFLDASKYINDGLVRVFDDIASTIDGFYYGRFDIKVRDWEGLYRGEGIKVLELNGAYSEPAHIYDPSHRITYAWKEIVRHMKIIYHLADTNKKRGYRPSTSGEFIRMVWKNYFRNKQVV